MKYLSNCHTHTQFCDGLVSIEVMAQYAANQGYVSLGFSPHSLLPYRSNGVMKTENVSLYKSEIERLKKLYSGKMEILGGIELDLDSKTDTSGFDFVIGSVHAIHSKNSDKYYYVDDTPEELSHCIQEFFGGDSLAMCREYFSLVLKNAARPNVNILGHFDLQCKYNRNSCFFDESSPEYRKIALKALDAVCDIRPDIIFEINTGGMFRAGRPIPYPAPFLLKRLSERNAKIILTSDTHQPEGLGVFFDEAAQLCRECGFKKVLRIRKSGFEELAL